ncbi:MAG: NAD(P)/FAD-dependent oxidoreductase [Ilumatobacteraceae bacterium]
MTNTAGTPTVVAQEIAANLETALAAANLPALIPLLVQLTGDERWLAEPYRPTRGSGLDDHDDGGLPPAVQAEIREAAFAAIVAFLHGVPAAIPEPSEALLVQMLSVSMAERIPDEYGPMLRDVLGLVPEADTEAGETPSPPPGFRVVVIGAGASGIALGHELGRAGIEYTILEKSDAVGGVWWHNRYPGCGVDTPSHLYCFSFFDDYDWPAYFSLRDTLHDYFETAATELGIRPHVELRTEVIGARYGDAAQGWDVDVRLPDGTVETRHADALVSAVGAFGRPIEPNLPGLDTFAGERAHTARWPEGLDLTGKRVGVIGNGASAMQLVPAIVDAAEHVVVLSRSAQWAAPFEKFQRPVPEALRWLLRAVPLYRLWYRLRLFWIFNDKTHPVLQKDPGWQFPDRSLNSRHDQLRELYTRYILDELGDRRDELAPHVVPKYPPFGKRMLMDNGWFRTMARADVTLNPTGAAAVKEHSIVAGDGQEYAIDALVLATGFDVVRFLAPLELVGRSGSTIRDTWDDDDPRAYLGTVVPDLPNFFCLYGPNLQPGHGGSLLATLESQATYVRRLLQAMFRDGLGSVEVRADVNDEYNDRVDAAHEQMVWTHPGMSTYYRNSKGRVVVNSPWRNLDYWRFTREPDLDEYVVEPRKGGLNDAIEAR